ncbi:MAG TPA: hypothetical protein VG796_07170 [Verrucomicrobiales bacterium]|nr:hypothetical protein [Verrucomicrobiales bacterium]
MKTTRFTLLFSVTVALLMQRLYAQVNSGSDGHDGALNPASNMEIDMADHPDGIYHYTSVNIPAGVGVTFKPNANNTPVVWLVQQTCTINGQVSLDGAGHTAPGGMGGPGGGKGGNAGNAVTASAGFGPGGGAVGAWGGSASYGSVGSDGGAGQAQAGPIYGNNFVLPLMGGSGGGGSRFNEAYGGGGGGGALLIASSQSITVNGAITALGGNCEAFSTFSDPPVAGGGAGSGGSVRLVAPSLGGTGAISVIGGYTRFAFSIGNFAGSGRVRLDALESNFSGSISGLVTKGFQPIILPAAGQGIQLSIASVAGSAVPENPSAMQAKPDVIIPAQQNNPVPIVVKCTHIPLNTEISVVVHPTNGSDVTAVGINGAGTLAASTATISLNMPRGGGIIYAKAVTGLTTASINPGSKSKGRSIAQTGWTADGQVFEKMEVTSSLGGKQQIAYITGSGKRYSVAPQ